MEYIAHPFPFKNHKLKIKQERSHLFFQSLISYRKAWDSIVCSSLPIQLFDSASIALESGWWRWHTVYCSVQEKQMKTWRLRLCGCSQQIKEKARGVLFSSSQMLKILYILPIHMWQGERNMCIQPRWVKCLYIWVWFISKYAKPVLPTHLKKQMVKTSLVSKLSKMNASEADLD